MLDHPLIVNLAPTGAVADTAKNPLVPVTVERIVGDVLACARLGVSVAHIHVRDADGAPSCDPRLFAQVIEGLRTHPDGAGLAICASTSGRHGQTLEQRSAVLDLPTEVRPDMASLTLGSLNFATGPSVNAPDTIRRLVDRMNRAGVKPELEIFDIGMIEFARTLIREGRLIPPFYFNVFLGNIGGIQATAQHLGFTLGILPESSIVSVGGIGRFQAQANALGAVCADGVRIGLEDNLWSDWHLRTPASNESMTRGICDICRSLGRPVADREWTLARLSIETLAPG